MQRLISLFHEPQEDWPGPADIDAPEQPSVIEHSDPAVQPTAPIYFAELMEYVRERNQKFRWPREGAD